MIDTAKVLNSLNSAPVSSEDEESLDIPFKIIATTKKPSAKKALYVSLGAALRAPESHAQDTEKPCKMSKEVLGKDTALRAPKPSKMPKQTETLTAFGVIKKEPPVLSYESVRQYVLATMCCSVRDVMYHFNNAPRKDTVSHFDSLVKEGILSRNRAGKYHFIGFEATKLASIDSSKSTF